VEINQKVNMAKKPVSSEQPVKPGDPKPKPGDKPVPPWIKPKK
jgi:hypothetical protein